MTINKMHGTSFCIHTVVVQGLVWCSQTLPPIASQVLWWNQQPVTVVKLKSLLKRDGWG